MDTRNHDINDFGQPLKHPVILRFKLSTFDRLLHPGRRFFVYFLTYLSVLLVASYFNLSLLWAVVLAFALAEIIRAIWFMPRGADEEVQERNKQIYNHLYSEIQSNQWAEVLIGIAAARKFDFYSRPVADTLTSLKTFLKEDQNMGSQQCFNGHHPTCAHKIPAPLSKWLNA